MPDNISDINNDEFIFFCILALIIVIIIIYVTYLIYISSLESKECSFMNTLYPGNDTKLKSFPNIRVL